MKFLPGKPISGDDHRPRDRRADRRPAAATRTPRRSASALEFEHGEVKALPVQGRHDEDPVRLRSSRSPRVDFIIDTGASADRAARLLRLASAPRSRSAALVLGGEARNFAFLGDGSFKTRPRLRRLPERRLGDRRQLQVADLAARSRSTRSASSGATSRPTRRDFVLTLSASVTGHQGHRRAWSSPARSRASRSTSASCSTASSRSSTSTSIGVSVKGNLFGGEIDAALIGGILKLDDGGRIIDPFDTITPVADRVFFVGVEGGFKFAGIGGFTIRLGALRARPADRPDQRQPARRHPARAAAPASSINDFVGRRRVLQDAAVDRRPVRSCAARLPAAGRRSRPTSG